MNYPKVREFLKHIATGTNIVIEDDLTEDFIYFEGSVSEYLNSAVSKENLTLIQSSVKNNMLNVRALINYEQSQFETW